MHQDPSGLTIEAAALGYMRLGWPVFVLGRSKRPVANCPACRQPGHDRAGCGCLTCHGFYAATTDPARLAAMLARVPGGLLAIRTGTASGLCVVDIDPRNDGRLDTDLMTPTATVATGGGGWHLYYRHPGGPTVPALPGRAGVDIKGEGGYVAAPPSVHPGTGQSYRWAGRRAVVEMPPALRSAIVPAPSARPAPLSAAVTRAAAGISAPDALLAAHLRAVQSAPEGRRRVTLYGAARGVARMVAAGAITDDDARAALTAAGQAAGQTDRDIRAAIAGAFAAEGAAA
jgi:Bifunctional DNA primase/polymerase, N-terminal